ncbi:MAG: hypothetical protein OEP95_03440 [Myxococcales bacterium]|nr:hypothetical protein [Myxococcales bacterium]
MIEPPELRIGDVARVEVAIVVPPGHRVQPIPAPDRVPGLWILEAEELPVERTAAHHVHRTRFKVRARETGEFAWPAQTAIVETPTGERLELVSALRPLVIQEVTGEFPGRREPFSFRAPASKTRGGGFALPALLGAGGTLLALALVGWVRRVRNRPPAVPAAALAVSSSRATQAALEAALDRLADDPVSAANAASAALRVHVAQRYAAPARTATTEELARNEAPPGARKRWPELLRLLRALDGFRFRAVAEDRLERDELSATLRDAQRFVGESETRLPQ